MIIPLYTEKRLANAEDRPPALSGLVGRIKDYLQSEYVAGSWRCDMVLSLLWHVRRYSSEPAPVAYLASSFSWASIKKSVSYPGTRRHDAEEMPYGSISVEMQTPWSRGQLHSEPSRMGACA